MRTGFILLAVLLSAAIVPAGPMPSALADPVHRDGVLIIRVQSSPDTDHATELRVYSKRWAKELLRARAVSAGDPPPFPDAAITVQIGKKQVTYLADDNGGLFQIGSRELLKVSPDTQKKLSDWIAGAKEQYYGALLPWPAVDKEIPRKAVVTVMDAESGLRFRAQRRAGSAHADMQPVTREDTRIMKEIYGGHWSWKRRAVLVSSGDRWIAGSMHGMPHGGDGIPDNDFRGHFCIHFLGSTTHGSHKSDPAHQLMVQKAAGTLTAYLSGRSPEELAELYIVGLNQQDPGLLRRLYRGKGTGEDPFLQQLDELQSVKLSAPAGPAENSGELSAEVRITAAVTRKTSAKTEKTPLQIVCRRDEKNQPWYIERVAISE
jgi:hypothetical protein